MGSVCGDLVKLGVLRGTQFAQGFALQLQPVCAVDKTIKYCIGDGGITEHFWMPQRLTDESLRYG